MRRKLQCNAKSFTQNKINEKNLETLGQDYRLQPGFLSSMLYCCTSSCVLCPKAGFIDDCATRTGSVLLSSAPRNWSFCPLVDAASSFLVFLLLVSLPSSPLVQSSEDSHVLRYVLSSLLGVAWWLASENVVLAPDTRLLHLTHVLRCTREV